MPTLTDYSEAFDRLSRNRMGFYWVDGDLKALMTNGESGGVCGFIFMTSSYFNYLVATCNDIYLGRITNTGTATYRNIVTRTSL